ncbi:MAG: hypothetical protein GXY83_37155 [Rhodopirellula sp.]|nr:hypothetical protein [Rhodopirellula sp.]
MFCRAGARESQVQAIDLLGQAVGIAEYLIVDSLFQLLEQAAHSPEISPRRKTAK